MFEKYGKILDVKIKVKREAFAFVEYDDIRDAEDAYEKYINFYIIYIKGFVKYKLCSN